LVGTEVLSFESPCPVLARGPRSPCLSPTGSLRARLPALGLVGVRSLRQSWLPFDAPGEGTSPSLSVLRTLTSTSDRSEVTPCIPCEIQARFLHRGEPRCSWREQVSWRLSTPCRRRLLRLRRLRFTATKDGVSDETLRSFTECSGTRGSCFTRCDSEPSS
jgi:hypothetical protein